MPRQLAQAALVLPEPIEGSFVQQSACKVESETNSLAAQPTHTSFVLPQAISHGGATPQPLPAHTSAVVPGDSQEILLYKNQLPDQEGPLQALLVI